MTRQRFPNLLPERLREMAVDHASALAIEREDYGWEPPEDVDRLVVNMLRHEYTDYDDHQTSRQHAAVCAAIAAHYPWLEAECERQVAHRAAEDARAQELVVAYERELAEEALLRKDKIEASKSLVDGFCVGQQVKFRARGSDRVGMVTSVGRTKVEVTFHLKSGQVRTARLHAVDVCII